jgi:hypothetical protein
MAGPAAGQYPRDSVHGAIQIEAGTFGSLGVDRKLDIVARTQQLCGRDARSCQVFCSETTYGRYNLGHAPICRITYRCGAALIRSVEAAREEPIIMRCPENEPATAAPASPDGR